MLKTTAASAAADTDLGFRHARGVARPGSLFVQKRLLHRDPLLAKQSYVWRGSAQTQEGNTPDHAVTSTLRGMARAGPGAGGPPYCPPAPRAVSSKSVRALTLVACFEADRRDIAAAALRRSGPGIFFAGKFKVPRNPSRPVRCQ